MSHKLALPPWGNFTIINIPFCPWPADLSVSHTKAGRSRGLLSKRDSGWCTWSCHTPICSCGKRRSCRGRQNDSRKARTEYLSTSLAKRICLFQHWVDTGDCSQRLLAFYLFTKVMHILRCLHIFITCHHPFPARY